MIEKANFIQKKKVQFMEEMVKDGSMTREFYQETIQEYIMHCHELNQEGD